MNRSIIIASDEKQVNVIHVVVNRQRRFKRQISQANVRTSVPSHNIRLTEGHDKWI